MLGRCNGPLYFALTVPFRPKGELAPSLKASVCVQYGAALGSGDKGEEATLSTSTIFPFQTEPVKTALLLIIRAFSSINDITRQLRAILLLVASFIAFLGSQRIQIKMATDSEVRQRKPAGEKQPEEKKARSKAQAEDDNSSRLDILRVLTFLFVASCGLSYVISSGESLFWGMKDKPYYLQTSWWQSKLVSYPIAPNCTYVYSSFCIVYMNQTTNFITFL